MENKKSNNEDLENLLRKKLQEVDQKPEADTWAKIAGRQSTLNQWLQLKHYAIYALPFVLAIVVAIAWKYQQTAQIPSDSSPAPTQMAPQQMPTPATEIPVANLEEEEPIESADLAANSGAYPKRVTALSRLNSVPASAVRFRTETGISYESPTTGTKVSIPANSLVDAAGRPVQGEVELMLREYRDISDFLASGIPMHYGDSRGEYFFNSGGMFEVRVSQNGEQLGMAPGQSYDVMFSPTGELAEASLFYFDESDGAWKYRSDQVFGKPTEMGRMSSQPPVVAEGVAVRNNRRNNKMPCLPALPELPVRADPIDWVSDGVRVGYELATQKTKMPIWFRKNPNLTAEALLNGTERGQVRMVRNRDLGELFFPEDKNNFYTELQAFKDCYFVRATDSTNHTGPAPKPINPEIYWDQIVISQELGNEVRFYLYSEKEGVMKFYADLTASIGNKTFDAEKVMAEYKRLRAERLKNFETLVNSMHRFLFTASMFQTEAEWCMSPSEWIGYFEAQQPMMAKRYEALVKAGLSTDNNLALDAWSKWRARTRELYFARGEELAVAGNQIRNKTESMQYALKVAQFGIYNCDQIFRFGNGREPDYIFASYRTDKGDRVYAASVSILERNTRLFVTLPRADQMLRLEGRALDVIVTDRDGRQYHLSGKEYAQLKLEGRPMNHFVVKDITAITRTPRDWATYLDM